MTATRARWKRSILPLTMWGVSSFVIAGLFHDGPIWTVFNGSPPLDIVLDRAMRWFKGAPIFLFAFCIEVVLASFYVFRRKTVAGVAFFYLSILRTLTTFVCVALSD